MLPISVRSIASAITAIARLNKFLLADEVEEFKQSPLGDDGLVINIANASFKWDGAETSEPTLQNITLKAKQGQKIAVIGDVGSGKSSLIAAILGQIRNVGETMPVPALLFLMFLNKPGY
jgi:ABC-type transport system involved in cytochrome bd biosynthesis fused ATPase/permease subunit